MATKRMTVSIKIDDYEWCKRNCLSLSALLQKAIESMRGGLKS